jgi:hypothetical protein
MPPSPYAPRFFLRAVLEDEPVGADNRPQRLDVHRIPEEMHRYYAPRARTDCGIDLRQVHQEGVGLDVDKHRNGADVMNGRVGGDGRERRRDDFVPGAHAKFPEGENQCVGAGIDTDAVGDAEIGGKFALEGGDILREHVAAGLEHAADRRVDLRPVGVILGNEVAAPDQDRPPVFSRT